MFKIDKDKVFWREIEGETILLNTDTGFYYMLNEIGSLVWEMIAHNSNFEKITARIANKYDGDYSIIQKDIKEIVKNLTREKLIETM